MREMLEAAVLSISPQGEAIRPLSLSCWKSMGQTHPRLYPLTPLSCIMPAAAAVCPLWRIFMITPIRARLSNCSTRVTAKVTPLIHRSAAPVTYLLQGSLLSHALPRVATWSCVTFFLPTVRLMLLPHCWRLSDAVAHRCHSGHSDV